MLLSRACEYAIQALLHIAVEPKGSYVLAKDIAAARGLPYHFLGKTLQLLVKSRLLDSQKGRGGGFCLARPAAAITLLDVVHAIEGPNYFGRCVLGLPECGDASPCPLHGQWAVIRQQLRQVFSGQTVAELLELTD